MSRVVIDASVGVEITCRTRRGRAFRHLIPSDAEAWVPEHFYAEVLGVGRRRWLVDHALTASQADAAVQRLDVWPLHAASNAPVVLSAWHYRHNLTPADALYVVLAAKLGAELITDDHRLASAPTLPTGLVVRQLPQ